MAQNNPKKTQVGLGTKTGSGNRTNQGAVISAKVENKMRQTEINLPKELELSFDIATYIDRILNLKSIKSGFFEFSFVTNEDIIKINKQYLKRSYSTDVISFNLGDNDNIVGDIYISFEQAKINADDFNNSFENEIKLLIIHGILHLLDYRDYTKEEKAIMNKEQNRLLELAS
jgi:probable rRNA maturation factor